jgi:CRISPR-associated protein Cas6/Cse3/CasE subtype I-E
MDKAMIVLELPVALSGLPNNRYELHQTAYELMLEDPDDRRDFIFCADKLMPGVLIRSATMPEKLRQHCVPTLMPENGKTYRFILEAHPTYSPVKGVRACYPARDEVSRLRWLAQRAETRGFEVLSSSVETEYNWVAKPGIIGKMLDHSTFSGTLTVTDETAMREAMVRGIGHCKTFGLGVMRLFNPS